MLRNRKLAIAGALVGAFMGLLLAYYQQFNCVQPAICNPDGAGGCLPGRCEVAWAWQRWVLPTVGALVGAGLVTAWQWMRRSRAASV